MAASERSSRKRRRRSQPAHRTYKTRAIVLRGRSYGEADRILTLFTAQRGKIDAIAKGARRTKSHLAGRLEFGNEVLLGMHRGRNLDVVVSADTEQAHWPRLVHPDRFVHASVVVELVDAFCEPDLPLPEVYALLSGALRAVAVSGDAGALLPRFSLRLLDALGLAPPVDRCVRCGEPLGEAGWLDADEGGFACDRCRPAWHEAVRLNEDDLANLRAISRPRGSTSRAALHARPRIAAAIEAIVDAHLGRRPKARQQAAGLAGTS